MSKRRRRGQEKPKRQRQTVTMKELLERQLRSMPIEQLEAEAMDMTITVSQLRYAGLLSDCPNDLIRSIGAQAQLHRVVGIILARKISAAMQVSSA